jgi:hypothetical protein
MEVLRPGAKDGKTWVDRPDCEMAAALVCRMEVPSTKPLPSSLALTLSLLQVLPIQQQGMIPFSARGRVHGSGKRPQLAQAQQLLCKREGEAEKK